MDPALIDPIVQYVQEERQIADVSNAWVGNYRVQQSDILFLLV
jgi:hypothetical protein